MRYILILSLLTITSFVRAQQQTVYGPMQFTSQCYDLEDHWVAFPKNEKTGKYSFGFVYMDMTAGLTFDLEGNFGVDADGKIHPDSANFKKTAAYKYRLAPNTKPVYAIPDAMLKDLGVKQVPDWLAIYHKGNPDKNSVAYKVTYGKHLNSAGAPARALVYLESARQTEPHAKGLEFELTYAYNELKQYEKAILVLSGAIANEPANPLFYRELGYAYMNNNDLDNAIKTYLKGIDIAANTDNDARAEMAWNLAVLYRDKKGDTDQYKTWGQKAKDWAPANSTLGRSLVRVTF